MKKKICCISAINNFYCSFWKKRSGSLRGMGYDTLSVCSLTLRNGFVAQKKLDGGGWGKKDSIGLCWDTCLYHGNFDA